jgi:urocanate hydratase
MLELRQLGSIVFDFGNRVCDLSGVHSVAVPDFRTEYLQSGIVDGRAPLIWVALSGKQQDITRLDQLALEMFPHDERLRAWLNLAARLPRFQGLPARGLWIARDHHASCAVAANELVARGEIFAPLLIARDASADATTLPGRDRPAFQFRHGDVCKATEDARADGAIKLAADVFSGAAWIVMKLDVKGVPQLTAVAAVADGGAGAGPRLATLFG